MCGARCLIGRGEASKGARCLRGRDVNWGEMSGSHLSLQSSLSLNFVVYMHSGGGGGLDIRY